MATAPVSLAPPVSSPHAFLATSQEHADKAWTLARSLQEWIDELSVLGSSARCARSRDLRSAIDSYEVCLEDGGTLPQSAWIARARRMQEVQ